MAVLTQNVTLFNSRLFAKPLSQFNFNWTRTKLYLRYKVDNRVHHHQHHIPTRAHILTLLYIYICINIIIFNLDKTNDRLNHLHHSLFTYHPFRELNIFILSNTHTQHIWINIYFDFSTWNELDDVDGRFFRCSIPFLAAAHSKMRNKYSTMAWSRVNEHFEM